MTPHLVIVGARGRLGTAAMDAFTHAGWRVTAVARTLPNATPTVAVTWLRTDVENPSDVQALRSSAPVDAVLHAVNPGRYTAAAWQQHALPMLQASMAVAQHNGALLMLPGNVYNYGPPMPARLTPDISQQPGTAMGHIRVAMESALRDAAATQGLRSVVVRAGNFFGAGTGSLLDRVMTTRLSKGKLQWIGNPDVATPWAYLPDLAQTFVAVGEAARSQAVPQSVHFAGHCVTGRDWQRAIESWARQRGMIGSTQPLKLQRLPDSLIRFLGLFNAEMATVRSLRHTYNNAHQLDNSSLRALIADEPHTPFDVAVARALDRLNRL